jgi:nicotinate-nucleotide adenylyltransferase
MKIGIYGGTFDPVHHGHLILAQDALEQLGLDRLLFIPARLSPHKRATRPADGAVRVAMIEAAIGNEPRFAIDDLELRRDPPSYTITTLIELAEKYPGAEFYLLIGQDNLADLPTWARIDDLTQLARFVVLHRGDEPVQHPYITLDRRVEISATEIRRRVANGESIRYLVPEAVAQIISNENLYRGKKPSRPKR